MWRKRGIEIKSDVELTAMRAAGLVVAQSLERLAAAALHSAGAGAAVGPGGLGGVHCGDWRPAG